MTTLNRIPNSRNDVVALAMKAVGATQTLGAIIGLLHNPAPVVATDYHTLVGVPGAPAGAPNVGKQAELNEATVNAIVARNDLKTTVKAGRDFGMAALRLLKNSLGSKLNPQWRAAGFTLTSLAMPRDPASVLLELRAYYRLHPTQESAEQNLTATRADALVTQLQDRRRAVGETKTAEVQARQARNAALAALRRRLSNLRNELAQILPRDDARWYEFGFKRPIDGRIPALVTGLALERGLPGQVRATWDLASLALNYRVKWRMDLPGAPETEVGLFTEREALIRGLPSGASVVIVVTARNNSGESAPTEVTIVVP